VKGFIIDAFDVSIQQHFFPLAFKCPTELCSIIDIQTYSLGTIQKCSYPARSAVDDTILVSLK